MPIQIMPEIEMNELQKAILETVVQELRTDFKKARRSQFELWRVEMGKQLASYVFENYKNEPFFEYMVVVYGSFPEDGYEIKFSDTKRLGVF